MNGEHKAGDGRSPVGLLTEADLRQLLSIGERKFKELRATGVIVDPIELGARCARWTWEDYEQILARLPRRARAAEPQTLAQGRRARIDAMKSSQQATPT